MSTSGLSANFFFVTLFKLSSIPFVDFLRISSDWSTNTTVWPLAAATWKLKKRFNISVTKQPTTLICIGADNTRGNELGKRELKNTEWRLKHFTRKIIKNCTQLGWRGRDKGLKQLEGKGKRNPFFPQAVCRMLPAPGDSWILWLWLQNEHLT